MKVYLLVLAVCGLAAAAPQNWPYRDSLMPYRYGYPSQTQYKYLPQIEDDEDVGPYLSPGVGRHDAAVVGRQDVVVGSDGQYSNTSLLQSTYHTTRPMLLSNKAWLAGYNHGDLN